MGARLLQPPPGKRMIDRAFSEIDLREMLEAATGYRADLGGGRWIIETTRVNARWEVIVEPDTGAQKLIVVTAYPVTEPP